MEAKPQIIEFLNEVLTAELTAINQYFAHAKLQENWGFTGLASKTRDESIDEMRHAETVMDRILFLDGMPNLQRLGSVTVGEDVPEQLQLDLNLEYAAIERFNRGVVLAREAGDNGTRDLLERMLVSEEEHADWLETQLSAIATIGLPNYLAQHLGS
jgi:bacterioferritin